MSRPASGRRVDVDLTVSDDEHEPEQMCKSFTPRPIYLFGPKGNSLRKRSALTTFSSLDEQALSAPNVVTPCKKNAKKAATPHDDLSIGSVGYKFQKQFDDGWYEGEVMEMRHGAGMRCISFPYKYRSRLSTHPSFAYHFIFSA